MRRRGKDTQRERLLKGMITAANRDGYAAANVSSVIGQAKVSRPTFYRAFRRPRQCFLSSRERRLRCADGKVDAALAEPISEHCTLAVIETLVAFAGSRPGPRAVSDERDLAGGPETLDARDLSVAAIARALDSADAAAAPGAAYPDLASEILIGARYRILGSRLRRGERSLTAIQAELAGWVRLYERPARATGGAPTRPASRRCFARSPARRACGRRARSGRGDHGWQKRRWLKTTGYGSCSRPPSSSRRGATRRRRSRTSRRPRASTGGCSTGCSPDKQDAFSAIHELGFQQLMAAPPVRSSRPTLWPERMWEALGAITDWLEKNPTIAHLGFVESYAVGPGAVQRVEDSLIAFTIFLQEGYQHQTQQYPPSRLALEAIVTSVFEILYREVRRSNEPQISTCWGSWSISASRRSSGRRQRSVHREQARSLPDEA